MKKGDHLNIFSRRSIKRHIWRALGNSPGSWSIGDIAFGIVAAIFLAYLFFVQ